MDGSSLPRLLTGIGELPLAHLDTHLEVHGPLPTLRHLAPSALVEAIDRSGLRGRGGASFPTAYKLRAVEARRGAKVVVANGAEGEPASKKDRMLLRELPHLVLDGVAVAARAVGAEEAVVTFAEADQRSARSLERAVRERSVERRGDDPRFHLFAVRDGFVSGQETALVSALNGEAGKPTFGARPFEHGVHRRPTLVQNVETLAHLALIARHGAAWFRQLGTAQEPGSRLVTMAGAVEAPGVYEIEQGVSLAELLDLAGAEPDFRAVLLGGYFG